MAKYTVILDKILKSGFDLGLTSSDYPIFDEAYRVTLNDKILEHYRFHEIGTETATRFKFYLNRTLREIMPYYNQLYETALLEIEPLLDYRRKNTGQKTVSTDTEQGILNTTNVDSTTTQTNDSVVTNDLTAEQSSNATSTTDKDSLSISSDTPQSELLIGDVENNLYASEANKVQDDSIVTDEASLTKQDTGTVTTDSEASNTVDSLAVSNTTNTTDSDVLEIFDLTDEGWSSSQSELLMKFRESIINIDMMVIEDESLRNCFMLLW